MKLVVDANVLFSFFKKSSVVRELVLDPELRFNLELYAPKLVLMEIGRHKDDVCSKFNMSPKDFNIMFACLSLFIKVVDKESFKEFIPKAEEILSPHIKDVPYAALALSLKSRKYEIGLWSNEKRLKVLVKFGMKVFSIPELMRELDL